MLYSITKPSAEFQSNRDKIKENMSHSFSKSHGEQMTRQIPSLFLCLVRIYHGKFAPNWPWKIHCLFFFLAHYPRRGFYLYFLLLRLTLIYPPLLSTPSENIFSKN